MSIYDQRPWLGRYGHGVPHDIEAEHESLLAAYRATAARDPDKTALQYFDRAISHRELDELSDALAAGLQDEGFGPGDRLAVYLQNVPQFVVAMIATWKAGGIMVSISPMLKHKELTAQLADSGATALVALESLWAGVARDVVADTEVTTVITTSELDFLDEVPELLAGVQRDCDEDVLDLLSFVERHRGRAPRASEPGPDDIAFLTYTSGTTGPSKGAMNSHRNVVFNATYRDWIGLTEEDVTFGVAPFFHITGLIGNLAAPSSPACRS